MGVENPKMADEKVAAGVKAGDIGLFEELIKRYGEKIKRYARKFFSDGEDINDVVQEIFIKTYVNIQSFDEKKKFSPWIYRIAHNEFVNRIKKKKKNVLPLFELDTFLPVALHDNSFNREIDRKDIQKMAEKCLDRLEPKYREPIILFYLDDLGYKEISEVMRIPISTVGVRIKRGKALLKEIAEELKYKP